MGKVKAKGPERKKQGSVQVEGNTMDGPQEPGGVKGFRLSEAAAAFSYELFDEAACRMRLLEKLHPDGARCPGCGLVLDGGARESFWAGRRCACGRCGRRFTARSGTVLDGTQLDDRQLYGLIVFINIGFTTARIAEILKVTPNTVRFWSQKFKILSNEYKKGE